MRKTTGGRSKRTADLPPVALDPMEFIRMKGEEAKERDGARLERANLLALGRNQIFFDQLESVAKKVFKNKITAIGPGRFAPPTKPERRTLNVMLSDLHFGSALDGKDSASVYGATEEARRLAAIVKQVIEYKIEHRDETQLVVHLLGDLIENQLHDPRVGEPLATQTCAAIHLLSQAIGVFSANFKSVTIHCATGNHGRFRQRHPERAVYQKWDSLETVIYFSLKQAAANLKNVTINIPKTPYYTTSLYGMGVFGTHGDTVFRPGNPGRSINVENIEHQSARIKSTLDESMPPLKLFVAGHVHVPSMSYLNSGEIFLTNGALVPSSSYPISMGILRSTCGQTLWETVPHHIVGDYRFVTVDDKTDQDVKLDRIIRPFTDF